METIKIMRPARPLIRNIAYWLATAIIVLETAAGSEWDLVRNPFVRNIFDHLGYPYYLLTILGVWKLPAAIVLVVPGFLRAKEWAYAGVFFVYSGAAASHFIMGQTADAWGPLVFSAIALVSWALRPAGRRLGKNGNTETKYQGDRRSVTTTRRSGKAIYWIATGIIAFCMLSGGIVYLTGAHAVVEGITRLGYPAYLLTILGVWKVLGGLTIVVPRLPILKEWAYAGIFFDLTGAAVSNAVSGMGLWHVAVTLFLAALTVVSWALRPEKAMIRFCLPSL